LNDSVVASKSLPPNIQTNQISIPVAVAAAVTTAQNGSSKHRVLPWPRVINEKVTYARIAAARQTA